MPTSNESRGCSRKPSQHHRFARVDRHCRTEQFRDQASGSPSAWHVLRIRSNWISHGEPGNLAATERGLSAHQSCAVEHAAPQSGGEQRGLLEVGLRGWRPAARLKSICSTQPSRRLAQTAVISHMSAPSRNRSCCWRYQRHAERAGSSDRMGRMTRGSSRWVTDSRIPTELPIVASTMFLSGAAWTHGRAPQRSPASDHLPVAAR